MEKESVLVVGSGRLAFSVTVCLLQAGHRVTLWTERVQKAWETIRTHGAAIRETGAVEPDLDQLELTERLIPADHSLAVALIEEDLRTKQEVIRQLEKNLPAEAPLAITTESIPLRALQEGTAHPGRIVGLNWVEPAHTTFFLELIGNENTHPDRVDYLQELARTSWQKDPYRVTGETGIRARLISALVREAFFLVENGYASIEDIDRACRNDAGYYLPFAGNCRYMDLMGTYAYGVVMKDLNRELATDQTVPDFVQQRLDQGATGMDSHRGFYDYPNGDAEQWDTVFRAFSYQIQDIIGKYPFQYLEENALVKNK